MNCFCLAIPSFLKDVCLVLVFFQQWRYRSPISVPVASAEESNFCTFGGNMSFACLKMFFLSLVFGGFTMPCSDVHSFLMSLLGVRRLLESRA